MKGRPPAVALFVVTLAAMSLATGCSLRHRAKKSVPDVTQESAPPDTLVKESPPPVTQAGIGTPRKETPRKPEAPPPTETASADTTAVPVPPLARPSLVPQLTTEERATLQEETQREARRARELLDQATNILTEEERTTISTARSLLDQSRRAEESEDYRLAANLAKKARILAEGVAPRKS
jgi:hypothetical protein